MAARKLPVVGDDAAEVKIRPNTTTLLPLRDYDNIIVSFSGGKDSLACVLHLLDIGAPRAKIELWHQSVDGEPGQARHRFMDWPVTESYCRAVAAHLGMPIYFQWKVRGYEGELLREKALTMPTRFELPDGTIGESGGVAGKLATRRMFPQTSPDLSVRWCSAYLKIDVAKKALSNDPRFARAKVLFLTGERREESKSRSLYAELERHSTTTEKRRVDQWRAIIDWPEQRVWKAVERHRIRPHPAYYAGFSRVSCMPCIFGNPDQWATIRAIAPETFRKIARYERDFGTTIQRKLSVVEQADKGTPYIARGATKEARDDAHAHAIVGMHEDFLLNVAIPPGAPWDLPCGAYGHSGGPT